MVIRARFHLLKTSYVKNFLTIAFITYFAVPTFAQVSFKNTQWKAQVSSQGEIKMEFKIDTFFIYRNGNDLISTFTFYIRQDTITIFKVGGGDRCAMNSKGSYRIEMVENGEKFYFRLIDEECYGRGMRLISSAYERIH